MQITPTAKISALPEAKILLKTSQGGAQSFKLELERARESANTVSAEPFQEMLKIQTDLLRGKSFSPRDLILYQIRASQYGLHVELLSKVGESVAASVRKFQQQAG